MKFESKYFSIFIHENAFENVVCDVVPIVSSGGMS